MALLSHIAKGEPVRANASGVLHRWRSPHGRGGPVEAWW
jgi:hypothetical protein